MTGARLDGSEGGPVSGRGIAGEIVRFLRSRAAPAASSLLAARFLRSAGLTESLATRLLRATLEAEGLRYEDGAGWHPPASPRPGQQPPLSPRLAAVLDPSTGRVVLSPGGVDPAAATLVMLDPRREAAAVSAALRREGKAAPARVASLARCLRGRVRLGRRADLAAICGALGVRWLDGEEAPARAAAIAACLAAAGADREDPEDVERDPSAAALPVGISRQELEGLPEGPGVYRFYDADGALLYVGKAANLRRRVGSYFTGSPLRAKRRFERLIHRLEFEPAGSELEALLAEARQIARHGPPGNVQKGVRERGRRYEAARCLALLLPAASGPGMGVIVLRQGRHFGHLRLGPRGGGRAAARRLLERALGPAPARRGARPEDQILNSWLARHGELAWRVELDSCRSAQEAMALLESAASRALHGGPEAGQGERLRPPGPR